MTVADLKPRWVGHADLDAFYASVEERDCPAYRDRPVVVGALPGHRGVVAAANYRARAFGIHSAMPIAEAYRRCPDAVYLRPDMAKYARVSRQIFQVLGTLTPVVEPVSIDEAYRSVDWMTVFLLAGLIPLGLAWTLGLRSVLERRHALVGGIGLSLTTLVSGFRLLCASGSKWSLAVHGMGAAFLWGRWALPEWLQDYGFALPYVLLAALSAVSPFWFIVPYLTP